MKKIVQLVSGVYDKDDHILYALTEDGKIYQWVYSSKFLDHLGTKREVRMKWLELREQVYIEKQISFNNGYKWEKEE